jgi:PAS domain S-box-containing protein
MGGDLLPKVNMQGSFATKLLATTWLSAGKLLRLERRVEVTVNAEQRIRELEGEVRNLRRETQGLRERSIGQGVQPPLYPEAIVLLNSGRFISTNDAWNCEIGDGWLGDAGKTLVDMVTSDMRGRCADLISNGLGEIWNETLAINGRRGKVWMTARKERGSPLVWLSAVGHDRSEQQARDYLLSQQYARWLVDSISCGLVILDRSLRVTYMNGWLREQVGEYDPELPPFCYTLFRYPRTSEPCPGCPALKTLADRQVHTLEVAPDSRKPDAWYNFTTSPIVGPEGDIVGVAALLVDISNTKGFERKLEASEALLNELAEYRRRILEQTCLGITTIDLEWNILLWNQGAERMFGYAAAEAVGKNATALLVPEVDSMWTRAAEVVKETGFWEGSFPLRAKGGRRVLIHSHISLMRDDFGRPIALIAVFTDLSIEERLKRRFLASDNRLKTIVEYAPFDVGAVDSDGVVTLWSASTEATTGIPKTVAVGSKLEDLLPKDAHCRHFLAEIAEVFRSRKMTQFEESAPRSLGPRKGQEAEEVTWLVPIMGRDGHVEGCVWYLWDATEFRRLQRELLRAERMAALGTLAGGVAHECNNIMGSIQLYAQVALKRADLRSSAQALNVVLAGVGRMKRIVRSLLEFSGDRPLQPRWINIVDIVEETLVLFERELEQKSISVVRDYASVPQVLADPHKMGQVFMNLIINARDAMVAEGGTLRVETDCSRDHVLIRISDTGRGIPEDSLHRVFEPFFTTKGPLSKNPMPGTGLGLSASHGIVQDHGGTITVESDVGKGTTFTISLPIKPSTDTSGSARKDC